MKEDNNECHCFNSSKSVPKIVNAINIREIKEYEYNNRILTFVCNTYAS